MRHDYGYFEEKELGKPYDLKLLRRLFPFTWPYRLLLFFSIVLVMLITCLDLSLPYVTKVAIDRYIVPKMSSAAADNTGASDTRKPRIRYLRADITDTRTDAVVRKYADLFEIDGSFARISYDDLKRLEKEDLDLIRKDDLSGLAAIAAVFLAIIVANFVFNFAQFMIMEYTGQMIMHDLRLLIFSHIQNLSVAFFTQNPVGRLVTRVTNDIQNMHELFTSVVAFVFKDLFLLTGIAVVLLSIDWKLALVSFSVLPFVLLASFRFSGQAREVFRVLRIKLAEINTRFSETIGGIKVIQLFMQEQENYRSFAGMNHENYKAGMRQIHVFAVFMPVIEVIGSVALAVVIFYGGGSVLAERITLGALVAFISYIKMFFRPIRDIAEKYNVLQNAMASAERIFLILDSPESLPRFASPGGGTEAEEGSNLETISEVTLEDVSFAYAKDETVLRNISLSVRAGETLAVVGPTGSGKTSLINLIVRFYDPTSGRVLVNGRDVKTLDASTLRKKLALVMQDPFLFSETIKENIVQGSPNISDETLDRIIEYSKCRGLVDGLPDGIHTVLSEGGSSISSGERQLLSIARAFARDPDLIILDEATSYVDSETEHNIQEALLNLMKDRTSIIIAHRLLTARRADRIVVLNRGKMIESGTHDELMKQGGFYCRLNQLQNQI
ncbi:MAG: ABC transporter ATP-binding protein [Deltaproteobacteria bacterium]|nr:ABC transporter ATP-binding protein [Deltaproteobacteria bacterium]